MKNRPVILLNESFPDWNDNKGIFSEMNDMPWSSTISAELLDIDYFGNHSGNKKCSPLVYALMEDDFTLSDSSREKLAALVKAKFYLNWNALWQTYHANFNPLDEMTITEVGSHEESMAGEDSSTKTGTNTGTDNTSIIHGEKIENEETYEINQANSRYGFNSSTAVPTEEQQTTGENEKTEQHSGTDQNNRTLNLANSEVGSGTKEESREGSYQKTRSGRTGNHTPQELLKQQRELWIEDYFTRIFIDVDTVLASMLYNREHKVDPYFMFGFGYNAI